MSRKVAEKSRKVAEKSRKGAVVVIAVLLVIVIALAATLGYVTNWYRDWGKHTGSAEEPKTEEPNGGEVEEQSGFIVTPDLPDDESAVAEMSISVLALDDEEEKSPIGLNTNYLLTATRTPASATEQVIWDVRWKGESEELVTDYVTITPTEEGALTANAKCLQEFDVPIEIYCALEDDSSIKATCTANYKVRYLGSEISLKVGYDDEWNICLTDSPHVHLAFSRTVAGATDPLYSVSFKGNDGKGTVGPWYASDNEVSYEIYVKNCFGFVMYEKQHYGDYPLSSDWQKAGHGIMNKYQSQYNTFAWDMTNGTAYLYNFAALLCPSITPNSTGYDKEAYYQFQKMIYEFRHEAMSAPPQYQNNYYHFDIKIVATFSDGTTHETVSRVRFDIGTPEVPPTDDLNFDKDDDGILF